jgi:hypothetical protein
MTDVVDLFLDPNNVERMNKIFKTVSPCGMRSRMHEFIYGPYMAGLYDIWTGTDADLYLRQTNDEFIKYMDIRYNTRARDLQRPIDTSARVEIASYLDPFERAREVAKRAETARPRRPITRGTGASMGGARQCADKARQCADKARQCADKARQSANGARMCAQRCSTRPVCDCNGVRGIRAGALVDEAYARWNRDQRGTVHLSTRDDEASDAGVPLSYTAQFARSARDAAPPYGFSESNAWMTDPTAGSGDAQYHLLALDSQMAILNEERTLPYGYGTTEEQLADDARVAVRHRGFKPEEGVIPKTSYKKLIRVQSATGRVTLDDDRKMANDIFSRDSKGFILAGRR